MRLSSLLALLISYQLSTAAKLISRWPDDGKVCTVYAKNFTAAEGFVVDSSNDILTAVNECGVGGTIVLGQPG